MDHLLFRHWQNSTKWLERQTVREISRATYKREVDLILPLLGKKKLRDLKTPVLRDALQGLAATNTRNGAPISSRTLAHVRTRLKSIFREVVIDQIIYVNPMEAVKPVKKIRTEHPHFSLDFDQLAYLHELGTQLHQMGLCRLWVAVLTAVSVGLRKSEVIGLRWQDIDLKAGRSNVRHTIVTEGSKPKYREFKNT